MKILTNRHVATWPSYQIVWEWEDCLSKALNCEFVYDNKLILNPWIRRFHLFQDIALPKGDIFMFEVSVSSRYQDKRRYNRNNIIPCIVDYFFKDEEMELFEKKFSNNPLVFISSLEVFERLKSLGCRTSIAHLPLSLPDKYTLDSHMIPEKKYDLIMMGRQNAVLNEFLNIYTKKHPDFVYVYENAEKGKFHYYTSKGDYVGYIGSRESYMALLKQSKVALYSTPGIDGGEVRTNGYNQVTPKFLEYLACGCNVIARWKDNPDTDFYDLRQFSENIDNYQSFENRMDEARNEEADIQYYCNYLKNHYTSSIVPIIRDKLEIDAAF